MANGLKLLDAYVEVRGDGKQVVPDVAKAMGNDAGLASNAGVNMGRRMVAGLAGVFAVAKIGSFLTDSISGASDLNETISAGRAIYGDAARGIEDWASRAATSVGLSKGAALGFTTGLGDMFTQLGFTSDAAAKMSTNTVQMAADLGSFKNLDTADVLDRINGALRGEYDSLQKVIPNINGARVEQEALAATGKAAASELTAQEKAAAVLAIVQKDGAVAMGDFARTQESAANQTKIAAAQTEDLQAQLGAHLLPAYQGVLSFINGSVIPMFSELVTWMGQNKDTVMLLGGVLLGAVVTYYALTAAMGVYKAFQIAAAAATGGLTFAQWALNAAMTANPIGIVIVLITALVAAIIWVATQTTFFQDAWAWMTETIGAAWQWLWDNVLNPVFTAIGAVFNWLYNNVILPVITAIMVYIGLWAAIITWLWQTAVDPALKAIGAVFQWVWRSVIQPVVDWIRQAWNVLGVAAQLLYANYVKPAIDAVGRVFQWLWSNVVSPVANFIGDAVGNIGKVWRSVFDGLAGFARSAFSAVLGAIRGPINGIIGLVNGAIGAINSVSVTIPDWVPVVGGQRFGLSIPRIPMLARGGKILSSGSVLVGEAGPEILTNMRGATVTPLSRAREAVGTEGTGDVHIGQLVVDARDFADYERAMRTLKEIGQRARQGRGNNIGKAA